MIHLVHDLVFQSALRTPTAEALVYQGRRLCYADLAEQVQATATGLLSLRLDSGERAAVYLEKRVEAVVTLFGIATAGATFVPVNPLLKSHQVLHILKDCNVRILVTSVDRCRLLLPLLPQCPELHAIVIVGATEALPSVPGIHVIAWNDLLPAGAQGKSHRCIDSDMAAILYTSGSTGKPKGVVLSHRNLIAGAGSVSTYVENTPGDRLLAVLPLSFDYGLNQLTTAFLSGAAAVLSNYMFPHDIVRAVTEEKITGLAGVPPLWHQLASQKWPVDSTLRYITNSGGAMPRRVLDMLRTALPATKIYLMYGLTEAFRSTYLPPSELDRRPDSIGRPIPNADVMVVREDGTRCEANEPGELVHRGALVSLGYWNDPEKTAERFRPTPCHTEGLPLPETAVWSGDTVTMDEEGYFYFVGRRDEMIKVSGYRISPTEVEEILSDTGLVVEAAAIGVPHPTLGQAIVVVVQSLDTMLTPQILMDECKRKLPTYMVPGHIEILRESLPRNPNGKIDRNALQHTFATLFTCEPEK